MVNSIQSSIRAAAAARGGHTRYCSLQLIFISGYGGGGGVYLPIEHLFNTCVACKSWENMT